MIPPTPEIGEVLIARQVIRGWDDRRFEERDEDHLVPVEVVFVYRDGRIQARDHRGVGRKYTFDRRGGLPDGMADGLVYLVRERVGGQARWRRA